MWCSWVWTQKIWRSTRGTWASASASCLCDLGTWTSSKSHLRSMRLAKSFASRSLEKPGKSLARKLCHEPHPAISFQQKDTKAQKRKDGTGMCKLTAEERATREQDWVCEKNLQRPNSGARPLCTSLILQLQERKLEYKNICACSFVVGCLWDFLKQGNATILLEVERSKKFCRASAIPIRQKEAT